MKKTFIALSMLIVSATSFAQIDKASWLVGGNLDYQSSKVASITTSSFTFSPNIGYFLVDKLAGGVRAQFLSSKVSGEEAITHNNIGPFLRYYFLQKNGKTNLFLDGNFSFGSTSVLGTSVSNTSYGFNVGPAFFLNKHTALEITLGYDALKAETDDVWTNAIKFGVGFQIHLGSSTPTPVSPK
jgi:hypothetical protein